MHPIVKQCLEENIRPCEQCRIYHELVNWAPQCDICRADWQYSKAYTKCLMEDIPTSAEMLDILTRRGIIGTEFEQRANELAQLLPF